MSRWLVKKYFDVMQGKHVTLFSSCFKREKDLKSLNLLLESCHQLILSSNTPVNSNINIIVMLAHVVIK